MARHTIELSKKPLLVAGHGIRIAQAQEELESVLNLGIPVVTTFNGFDLVPNDHPSYAGRAGTLGTYGGRYALDNCDVLICVGTRNNMRQIGFDWGNFAPQAKRIVVDIDPAELYKPSTPADVPVEMDAKKFLANMSAYNLKGKEAWRDECHNYEINNPIDLSPDPYNIIHKITMGLPEDSIIVCGNGTACVCMFQAGIVKKGQRIFWNSGCASMGYALPAAIGAHFATKKRVVCITGDGSIQMNIQELQTIKHHKLPIKIVVLNNEGYRSIEMTQDNYFDGDYIGCNKESGVSFPSLKNVAETYGFTYTNSWENRICDILRCNRRCVYEVFVGNDYIFKPKFTKPLEAK